MIYTQVSNATELAQILALQSLNHLSAVDADVAADQGFLTVRHDPDVLGRMNAAYPSVVAKDGAELAGYCLVMPPSFAGELPILAPMFDLLGKLEWNGRRIHEWRWFVMGQVCVAEKYRGQGVFDGLYRKLRECCAPDFDLVVTEIAVRNARSLRAHERVGFERLHRYFDPENGEEWWVVVLKLP
ncbi:MAG TPA: GNAT family protein [Saprospiraceae bacterium]|nr:GNAT family protein [Saprospiraceae bacterium]